MAENVEDFVARITVEDEASAAIDGIATKAEALSGKTADVAIGADDAATPVIDAVEGETAALGAVDATVDIAAEDNASDVIDSVASGAGELAGMDASVTLGADDNASDVIGGVADAAGDLSGTDAQVSITADDGASDVIAEVVSSTETLAEPVSVVITADTGASMEDIAALGTLLQGVATDAAAVGQESVTLTVVTDEVDSARELLTDMGADIQAVTDNTVTVSVDTSQLQAAATEIQNLGGAADEAGTKAFKGTGKLKALGKVLGGVQGIQGQANQAVSGIMAFATTLEQITPAAAGATSAISGVGLAIGVAGLALGIGTQVIGLFDQKSAGMSKSAKALVTDLDAGSTSTSLYVDFVRDAILSTDGLDGAIKKVGTSAGDIYTGIMAGQVSPELQNAITLNDTFKGGLRDLSTVMNGPTRQAFEDYKDATGLSNVEAFDSLKTNQKVAESYSGIAKDISDASAKAQLHNDILKDLVANSDGATSATIDQALANNKNEEALQTFTLARQMGIEIEGKSVVQVQAAIDAQNGLITAQGAQSSAYVIGMAQQQAASDAAKVAVMNLGKAIGAQGESYDTTANRASAFVTASAALLPTTANEIAATSNYEASLDALGASFEENGKTIDLHTEKGRANSAAIQQTGDAINGQIGQLVASGASYDEVGVKADGYRDKLSQQLKSLGLNDAQIHEYISSMGLTPEQIATRIELTGQEEAKGQIAALGFDINSLPKDVQTEYRAAVLEGDYQHAKEILADAALPDGDPRKALFLGAADTIQSDDDLARSASKERTATIGSKGDAAKANAELELARAKDRVATLTAKAETAAASGDLKGAAAARTAIITAQANVGSAQAALDNLTRTQSKIINVKVYGADNVPKMAGGPINESGFYTVGEAGRETVFLPKGAYVGTAGQTMTGAGAGGNVTIINNNFNVTVPLGASKAEIGASIADALDAFYRVSGSRLRSA